MTTERMTSAEYRKAQGLSAAGEDRKPIPRSEGERQRDASSYFDHLEGELFAFHIPNGGKRRPIEAAILHGMGVKAGVADWCVMFSARRVLWIEMKTEEGSPSQAQRDFRATCKRLGHLYLICRTVAEVHDALVLAGVEFREDLRARELRETA